MPERDEISQIVTSNGAAVAPARDLQQETPESIGTETSDSREARIAELQKQVQAGSYKVDAHELSVRLVEKHIIKR